MSRAVYLFCRTCDDTCGEDGGNHADNFWGAVWRRRLDVISLFKDLDLYSVQSNNGCWIDPDWLDRHRDHDVCTRDEYGVERRIPIDASDDRVLRFTETVAEIIKYEAATPPFNKRYLAELHEQRRTMWAAMSGPEKEAATVALGPNASRL